MYVRIKSDLPFVMAFFKWIYDFCIVILIITEWYDLKMVYVLFGIIWFSPFVSDADNAKCRCKATREYNDGQHDGGQFGCF